MHTKYLSANLSHLALEASFRRKPPGMGPLSDLVISEFFYFFVHDRALRPTKVRNIRCTPTPLSLYSALTIFWMDD